MKVLAILQNQWFRDPDRVRFILDRARFPQDVRRRLIHYALFAGCRTGRVLKAGLGEDWCRDITWEEASPEIGGEASSVFPADPAHILKVIAEVKPTVIIALGKIAADALMILSPPGITLLTGPHPTARGVGPLSALRTIRAALDTLVNS